jgi:hypothetical protein
MGVPKSRGFFERRFGCCGFHEGQAVIRVTGGDTSYLWSRNAFGTPTNRIVVAIELDGDKHHSPDKWQMILAGDSGAAGAQAFC